MPRRSNTPVRRRSVDRDEAVGLPWAAANAPSPAMREFACVALARGLSLGDVARRLNVRDRTKLTTRNVAVHFQSSRPRPATIDAYADVLGVTEAHLASLDLKTPKDVDLADALYRSFRTLLLRAYEFQPGTPDLVVAWIEPLDEKRRAMIGRAATLAEERERHNLRDGRAMKRPEFARRFGQTFAAFADALLPEVNLFDAARKGVDSRLVSVWKDLGFLFTGDAVPDAEHVISFIVRLLRSRDVDTTEMEAVLTQAQLYFKEGLKMPVPSLAAAIEPLSNTKRVRHK